MTEPAAPPGAGAGAGSAWGDAETRYFFELTPERVLEAVESAGLVCTGRCQALNSFENRVYDVELDGLADLPLPARRRVVKFYRPGRWSEAQILEEHRFLLDLVAAEVPAIAPLAFAGGETLRRSAQGIWYALFARVGGRAPDELSDDQLIRLGRLLARVHAAGAAREAPHRIRLDPATYGRANLEYLLARGRVPLEFSARYEAAARGIFAIVEPWFAETPVQRIHGDCHLGNLLWHQDGPFFLDFDDMVRGPVVQDVWMLVPGRDDEARAQREALLEGYAEMRAFDRAQLRLIEPLRALRFIHYSAWIARRWEDPAFPLAFPQFESNRYWQDETADLETQLRLIQSISLN